MSWISVTIALPEQNVDVYTYGAHKYVDKKVQRVCWYAGKQNGWCDDNHNRLEVTHWRPVHEKPRI